MDEDEKEFLLSGNYISGSLILHLEIWIWINRLREKRKREGKRLRNSLPYLLHSLATNELCTSFVLISTHTHTHTHSHTYSHTHSLTHTFTHTFTHTSVKIGKSRKRILKFRQWPSRVGVASFLTLKRQWIQHLAFCKDEMRCASEC